MKEKTKQRIEEFTTFCIIITIAMILTFGLIYLVDLIIYKKIIQSILLIIMSTIAIIGTISIIYYIISFLHKKIKQ